MKHVRGNYDSLEAISAENNAMITASTPPRPTWRILTSLLFIAAYVAMDWASYLHPLHGLNITAWNPAPALGVVFALRWGRWVLPPLFLSLIAADFFVRGMPESLPASMLMAGLITVVYYATGVMLRRLLHAKTLFGNRRDLLIWLLVTSAGVLTASVCFVTTLYLAKLLPADLWLEALVRYWIGDSVGVLLCMPLFALLADTVLRKRFLGILANREILLILAFSVLVLWLVFGPGSEHDYKYFYCLFLPVIWAGSRQGLFGAIATAAWVQLGVIVFGQFLDFKTVTVFELQMLALAIAMVGFFVGVVVDEYRQASEELRHSLRLAAAGEMAAALAHELNQPLTALTMYAKACEFLLEKGDAGNQLQDTMKRLLGEANRAAEVVRRLRDFFRTGATKLEPFSVEDLLLGVSAAYKEKLSKQGIELMVDLPTNLMTLFADRLQIEVALRNLVSNAGDAVQSMPEGARMIKASAHQLPGERVCIQVEDSGSGLAGKADSLFEPFVSTKSSGMGLGLAISRAIAEAHGGTLWAEEADHGVFKLVLPLEGVHEERE